MAGKTKKEGNNVSNVNKFNPTWISVAIVFFISVMGGAFAYGQARDDIEDNATDLIGISEDVEENTDDIVDIQIVLAEFSEMARSNIEMTEMMKEYIHRLEEDD